MLWVTTSSLRRSTRSASAPARGPPSRSGSIEEEPSSPSANPLPVSWSTSQEMATAWVNVPETDRT